MEYGFRLTRRSRGEQNKAGITGVAQALQKMMVFGRCEPLNIARIVGINDKPVGESTGVCVVRVGGSVLRKQRDAGATTPQRKQSRNAAQRVVCGKSHDTCTGVHIDQRLVPAINLGQQLSIRICGVGRRKKGAVAVRSQTIN